MFNLFNRLRDLEHWRKYMDAQVTMLASNIGTLQTEVTAVLAELQSIQAQLAAGIDAADEAAITAANTSLAAVNAQLAAVLPPIGVTGAAPAAKP